jgi:hypothetical protein
VAHKLELPIANFAKHNVGEERVEAKGDDVERVAVVPLLVVVLRSVWLAENRASGRVERWQSISTFAIPNSGPKCGPYWFD